MGRSCNPITRDNWSLGVQKNQPWSFRTVELVDRTLTPRWHGPHRLYPTSEKVHAAKYRLWINGGWPANLRSWKLKDVLSLHDIIHGYFILWKHHLLSYKTEVSVTTRYFSYFRVIKLIMRRFLSTMTQPRPRRFAPLKAAADGHHHDLPKLQGVIFDVDGTLW